MKVLDENKIRKNNSKVKITRSYIVNLVGPYQLEFSFLFIS